MLIPFTSDLITQYLPWYFLVAEHLKTLQLPHWIPGLYQSGYPLLAEGETGVLSPINSLILGVLPFPLSVDVLYLAYAAIAFSGMVYCLRLFKKDWLSSFFAGAVFTVSGFMVTRYFQPAIIFTSALLPWGMALVQRGVAARRVPLALAFILYLQFTAGHVQMTLISFSAYLAFAFLLSFALKSWLKFVLKLLAVLLLGIGLSALQLLPTIKLYELSERAGWDKMIRFTYSLPLSHLITYLSPKAFGISEPGDNFGFTQFGGSFWEFNLTIWTLPFLLSLAPLFARFKNKRTITMLYLLWGVFILVSLGGYFPPYRIVGRFLVFPFRAPSRFLLVATFAASALSGVGLSLIAKRATRLWLALLVLAVSLWQLINQLKNYVVMIPAERLLSEMSGLTQKALTTPLPLKGSQLVNPEVFRIEFQKGVIISLLSLSFIVGWWYRTRATSHNR